MSQEKVSEARVAALSKAGLTPGKVGREQNSYEDDGSVELSFYARRGGKKFLARVRVDPNGAATVLDSA